MDKFFVRVGFWIWILVFAGPALAQDNTASDRAVVRARAYFTATRARFPITDPVADLRVRSVRASANGEMHIRFDRYYKNVRVFEGEAIAHVKDDQVRVTNALGAALDMAVTPSVTEGAARTAAANALRLTLAADADVRSSLEILMKGRRSPRTVLVWHISLYSEELNGPAAFESFVDARTGAIVWSYSNLHTADATGVGNTMYSGQTPLAIDLTTGVYSLKSPVWFNIQTNDLKNRQAGKGTIFTNSTGTFGNSKHDSSDPATAAADAHYGTIKTLDYFLTTFNRHSVNGAGSASYNRVHYGRNYDNAFWSDRCFCMTFGDGGTDFLPVVGLDVTAHEMAHGVDASEANLTYADESGGLNESNSDIFGTAVETFANNATDTPDYWIGERIMKSNWSGNTYTETSALRYMDDPAKDGNSPACWSAGVGQLDVHFSSGPNNHMFYLLANGGTSKCNGKNVTGIGIDKAARIWYEALTNQMTASTNYHEARFAMLAAATTLYGQASPERDAVESAYAAINVVPLYSLTDLGILGCCYSEGYAVNNAGEVAGEGSDGTGRTLGWFWSNGPMVPLGVLPGGISAQAYGMNDAGQIAGVSDLQNGNISSIHAVIWDGPNPPQDIGALNNGLSRGISINELGQVAGWGQWSGDGFQVIHALFWPSPGAPQDLGTLGGTWSYAYGINDAGAVTGVSALSGDTVVHAFIASGPGFEDLGAPKGSKYSQGQSINNLGQVVGYYIPKGQSVAYAAAWDTSWIDLGILGGGGSSIAYDINDNGQIVGSSDSKTGNHAFIYESGVIQDLNHLIPEGTGWVLTIARSINDVGQITGRATVNGQEDHAFLLTPLP